MSIYEKACKNMYFEKYSKNGNLVRTAEQFDGGSWIVLDFNTKKLLNGEYTDKEFKNIKKYFLL